MKKSVVFQPILPESLTILFQTIPSCSFLWDTIHKKEDIVMSSIKVSELRPTMDYLLCVLEAHGLAEPSIKDYRSTFGAFERYVREREVGMVSDEYLP